jgi:hypothetical protein
MQEIHPNVCDRIVLTLVFQVCFSLAPRESRDGLSALNRLYPFAKNRNSIPLARTPERRKQRLSSVRHEAPRERVHHSSHGVVPCEGWETAAACIGIRGLGKRLRAKRLLGLRPRTVNESYAETKAQDCRPAQRRRISRT